MSDLDHWINAHAVLLRSYTELRRKLDAANALYAEVVEGELALLREVAIETEKLFPFLPDIIQRSTRGQSVRMTLAAWRSAQKARE